jgi:ribosomal protein L11 methyltransferase
MNTGWLVLEVRSPSAEQRDALTEGLIALGADAVVESGDWLSTWLPGQNAEETVAQAQARLSGLAGADVELRWSIREDQDWSKHWREGLQARRVSPHMVVTPTWVEPDLRDGDVVITIDPQMAFGTGEHASTRGALRLIEAAIRPGSRVLDVGTGSAILAIAAALLGAAHVDGVEYDNDALINARENVARHACDERVSLHEALVDLDYLTGTAAAGGYDLIAGNVLSGVLVPLLPGFRSALRPDGTLILAGIMAFEADGLIEAASATGFLLEREDRDEEWWGGSFRVVT